MIKNMRIVLWVVFLGSLLLLWDNWQRFNGHASLFMPAPVKQSSSPLLSTPVTDPARNGQAILSQQSDAVTAAGEVITLTTDLLKVDIDTVGGELRRLELLTQKEEGDTSLGSGWKQWLFPQKKQANNKNVVLFDKNNQHTYVAQTGLLGNYPNHKTVFTAQPGVRVLDQNNQVQLVLEARQNGVKLTKTYTLHKGSYLIGVSHQIVNEGNLPVTPSLYMQLVRDGSKLDGESSFYSMFTGPAVYTDAEKFQKLTFDEIQKGEATFVRSADNGWFAMVQHYFVSGIIPLSHLPREIFSKTVGPNLFAVGNVLTLPQLMPGQSEALVANIYSGPLITDMLEKVAPGFGLAKDYGWTTIVAKPLFWLMDKIHDLLHNWGWTIIVLTVIIKILFFPLSASSFRSMGKMKLLTPKMMAIREQHKDNPQQMNQAMMALYKTEKVNPLGGCLPLLIQTPVFMALYSVVLASAELRHAPWLSWVHDLSAPDPFLILPLLMALSMYIQTKLNPAPADPMQAKMMMIMPLVFSVMFFFFPSGLVLYWVVNNILSIIQQWIITQNMAATT